MSDELASFWFVAAVFREPNDLTEAIVDLRAHHVSGNRLLAIASHAADDAREALGRYASVPIFSADSDGALLPRDVEVGTLPHELRAFLDAMNENESAGGPREAHSDGERSQVYHQLRQDAANGAFVLVVHASDPDEQLRGARILLHAKCECVLTHEMVAGRS